MKAIKFVPLDWHVRSRIRLEKQYKGLMFSRRPKRKDNRRLVARIFGHCHYLCDHAPMPIQKRWAQARARWMKRLAYSGSGLHNQI